MINNPEKKNLLYKGYKLTCIGPSEIIIWSPSTWWRNPFRTHLRRNFGPLHFTDPLQILEVLGQVAW